MRGVATMLVSPNAPPNHGTVCVPLEGKRYLDFVSGLGVNALGHAHPRIVKTIREQAARLIHISNLYYHEYSGGLAEKLCG